MLCHVCLTQAPTRPVGFDYNLGLLFLRYEGGVRGELCKACVHRYYWKYTALNLACGWWGLMSFLMTWFFLIRNSYHYIEALAMGAPEREGEVPALTEEHLEKLRPHLDLVLERLDDKDRTIEGIAAELAEKSQASIQAATLFVHLIRRTAGKT